MATAFPFSITPDAEDYLRNRLSEMPCGAKPVLMMTMSQTDGEKPPRWIYEGQSFIIGFFDPTEAPKEEYAESELFGHPVGIESEALKQLSGHTLNLRRVDARYGLIKNTRYILVADSAPKSTASTSEANEKTRRNFSTAALSVLGGFTGMGVVWIVAATVVNPFKISDNKFLPLAFPLFVIGWVVGAIVSFFFFRKAFKANGGTKFVQEQTERKYLGYGVLSGQLSWWIFLGIPIPLIAMLVFLLEPFVHTDGQKAGVAVGVLMVVFAASMYFCDRIPRRIVIRLGLVGWALTIIGSCCFFEFHGP